MAKKWTSTPDAGRYFCAVADGIAVFSVDVETTVREAKRHARAFNLYIAPLGVDPEHTSPKVIEETSYLLATYKPRNAPAAATVEHQSLETGETMIIPIHPDKEHMLIDGIDNSIEVRLIAFNPVQLLVDVEIMGAHDDSLTRLRSWCATGEARQVSMHEHFGEATPLKFEFSNQRRTMTLKFAAFIPFEKDGHSQH